MARGKSTFSSTGVNGGGDAVIKIERGAHSHAPRSLSLDDSCMVSKLNRLNLSDEIFSD